MRKEQALNIQFQKENPVWSECSMVIDPLFDGLYTPTISDQPYNGSSSSSQQEPPVHNYVLPNPQFFPPLTDASNTELSNVIAVSGLYDVSNHNGQNQQQVAEAVSPDYQRIRSNNALNYICQMLMEDVDERVGLHQGEDVLQAAEKPFYDILAQVHPSSLSGPSIHSNNEADSHDENTYNKRLRINSPSILQPLPTPLSPYGQFLPYQPLTSTGRSSRFGFPALQLRRGVEEAKGFDKLVIYLDHNRLSICRMTTKEKAGERNRFEPFQVTDHRKDPYTRDLNDLGGRSSVTTSCEIIRNKKFDRVLICRDLENFEETLNLREMMTRMNPPKGQGKRPSQHKLKAKKQLEKEVVDLRSLLIHCAQAVAADDRQLASDLLRKIRQHSSADGDCTQRLAFCLLEGLEARLAGIGSKVYYKLTAKRISDETVTKAYNLYLASCPFHRASYTFANQTIIETSKGKSNVHIIDFGICFGLQWPSLIQRFAELGVQSKLRITGIDVPRPGIDTLEGNEEVGKRLADYANEFKVPFEYQGISSRFETIQIEDLNIEDDEVVIINCLYRMKNLSDETVSMNSARDRVLKIMRRMNPQVFIFGIVNGSYSSPFFLTRFKEFMFQYSSFFDLLDANVPRDNEARKMIERGWFARDALNIIACEGAERKERPETYKQWQVRCLKAGFEQLPVNPTVMSLILHMKKEMYHEDFVADEDSGWLLQGWKGRVIHAISKWKPNESHTDM